MYGIDILVDEHKNIIKATNLIERECVNIINGKDVDIKFFRECIEFCRNYADKHHHGKEEKILFKVMTEKLGKAAEKLIRYGMLVEHDLGRFHIGELLNALEVYEKEPSSEVKLAIITNAMQYAYLLRRHIEKEDNVVYSFADRNLSDELKESINEETKEFEKDNEVEKYLKWLDNNY